MKYPGVEYAIGISMFALVLAITGVIFYALMANCVCWIVCDLMLKRRHIVAIAIHAVALAIVVAIWKAIGV